MVEHITTREQSLAVIRERMPTIPLSVRARLLLFWGFKHRTVSCCAGHCAADLVMIAHEFDITEEQIDATVRDSPLGVVWAAMDDSATDAAIEHLIDLIIDEPKTKIIN